MEVNTHTCPSQNVLPHCESELWKNGIGNPPSTMSHAPPSTDFEECFIKIYSTGVDGSFVIFISHLLLRLVQ